MGTPHCAQPWRCGALPVIFSGGRCVAEAETFPFTGRQYQPDSKIPASSNVSFLVAVCEWAVLGSGMRLPWKPKCRRKIRSGDISILFREEKDGVHWACLVGFWGWRRGLCRFSSLGESRCGFRSLVLVGNGGTGFCRFCPMVEDSMRSGVRRGLKWRLGLAWAF
jgi:hypothetical protein